MSLDQRLSHAARRLTDELDAPEIDVDSVRTQVRTTHRRRVALTASAAALAIATSAILLTDRDPGTPEPAGLETSRPVTSSPPPTAASALDTSSWTAYTTRYGVEISHPPDWSVLPATRAWDWEQDLRVPWEDETGYETFLNPDRTVAVSVWSVPLEPGTAVASTEDVVAWVQDFCDQGTQPSCGGIQKRAVDLCGPSNDCATGVLVPFTSTVQAYVHGGAFAEDAITVVGVWRGPSWPLVPPYLNARRLLDGFLSTMNVTPATPTSG